MATFNNGAPTPVIYRDTASGGRLIWIRSNVYSLVPSTLIATGEEFGFATGETTATGSFSYVGGYLWNTRSGINSLYTSPNSITIGTLTANLDFTAGTFDLAGATTGAGKVTALTVTGGTLDATTGAFSSVTTGFTFGTTSGYTATVHGQVHGAGDSFAKSISGVFATSNSDATATNYAGGFIGAAATIGSNARAATSGGYSIGQATRSVFDGAAHDTGSIFFLGADYATRRDGLNTASDAIRDAQILSNLDAAVSGGVSNVVTRYSGVTVTHGTPETTANATVWEDIGRRAKLFAFSDLYVAGGKPLTGAPTSGVFEYEGAFISAAGTALGTEREGDFTLDVNFQHNIFTFTGTTRATPGDSSSAQTSRLVLKAAAISTGTLVAATGRLTGLAEYIEGDGSTKTADAYIEGRLYGAGGRGVAGLFTTDRSGTNYAGGFVGSVVEVASRYETTPDFDGDSPADSAAGFASSRRLRVPGASSTGQTYLFAAANLGTLLEAANSPVAATSDGAFLAKIGAESGITASDGTLVAGLPILTGTASGATFGSPGTPVPIDTASDWLGLARYAHAKNTGRTGTDSAPVLFVGGDALTLTNDAPLSGNYTWLGRVIYGDVTDLNTANANTTTITADFDLDTPVLTLARPVDEYRARGHAFGQCDHGRAFQPGASALPDISRHRCGGRVCRTSSRRRRRRAFGHIRDHQRNRDEICRRPGRVGRACP